MSEKKPLHPLIIPSLIVVASGLLLFILERLPGASNTSVTLRSDLMWGDYSSLFTNLMFVTLLAERFIEVFLGAMRVEGKQARQLDIDYATSPAEKKSAELALDVYRAGTEKRAMYIAFAVGLVSAIAGLRTLQIVFDAGDLAGLQAFLFNLMDVLLTAGVIAGGSSGINQITSLFHTYFQTQTKNAKAMGSAAGAGAAPAAAGGAAPPPEGADAPQGAAAGPAAAPPGPESSDAPK